MSTITTLVEALGKKKICWHSLCDLKLKIDEATHDEAYQKLSQDEQGEVTIFKEYFRKILFLEHEISADLENFLSPKDTSEIENVCAFLKKNLEILKHPVFISHYSHFVVGCNHALRIKSNYAFLKKIIDSNIAICEQNLMESNSLVLKIQYTLELAITINYKIAEVKKTMINLQNHTPKECGYLCFAFKSLLLDFKGKVDVSPPEENELVTHLEEVLEEVNQQNPVVHSPEDNPTQMLAEYYADKKDENNLKRVLSKAVRDIEAMPDPGFKVIQYKVITCTYDKYISKGFAGLKQDKAKLLQRIQELGLQFLSQQTTTSYSIPILKEHIDSFLKAIFGENNCYSLQETLGNIANLANFYPRKKEIEAFTQRAKEITPFTSGMHITELSSGDGRMQATIDPQNIYYQAREFISDRSIFLYLCTNHLKTKTYYKADEVIGYCNETFLFDKEDFVLFQRAVQFYWQNDFIVAFHLFMPGIEKIFRKLLEKLDVNSYKKNQDDGYDVISLHKILESQELANEFNEDEILYFKTILVENVGFNLRNNWAHGLETSQITSETCCNLLFHIVLVLRLRFACTHLG